MCHRISTSEAEMQPARAAYVRFRTCTAKVTPIPTRRGACSTTYLRREGLFDPVSIVLALKRPERIQAISLRLMGGDSQCNASRERNERCGSIPFLSPRSPLCDSSDFTRRPEGFQNVFKTNTVRRSTHQMRSLKPGRSREWFETLVFHCGWHTSFWELNVLHWQK